MRAMVNPTGKHRRKRRHHGEGAVILRRDRWRARPWAAVVPYLDESGRRREMWLSAASRETGTDLETVRRILGHRDIATTLRYIGKTPDALRGAAERIEEAMG